MGELSGLKVIWTFLHLFTNYEKNLVNKYIFLQTQVQMIEFHSCQQWSEGLFSGSDVLWVWSHFHITKLRLCDCKTVILTFKVEPDSGDCTDYEHNIFYIVIMWPLWHTFKKTEHFIKTLAVVGRSWAGMTNMKGFESIYLAICYKSKIDPQCGRTVLMHLFMSSPVAGCFHCNPSMHRYAGREWGVKPI